MTRFERTIFVGSLVLNVLTYGLVLWLLVKADTDSPVTGDPNTFCTPQFCVVRNHGGK